MAEESEFYTVSSGGRTRALIPEEKFDALTAAARKLESDIGDLMSAVNPSLSDATPGDEVRVDDFEQLLSTTKRLHDLSGLLLREQTSLLVHLFGRTTRQSAGVASVSQGTASAWSRVFAAEHREDIDF